MISSPHHCNKEDTGGRVFIVIALNFQLFGGSEELIAISHINLAEIIWDDYSFTH